MGHATTFTHYVTGRPLTVTFPDGSTTATTYDAGRLEQITDALGQVTRHGYGEVGNRVSQTDAYRETSR